MLYTQEAGHARLKRARWFITTNARLLGDTTTLPGGARLGEVIGGLDEAAAAQVRTEKQGLAGTLTREQAREALRKEMSVIGAAALLHPLDIPIMKMSKLRVPAGNASDGSLLAAARAMQSVVPEFHQMFLDEHLPADFEATLAAAITALEDALVDRDGNHLSRHGAGVEVKTLLRRGRAVLGILDAHITKVLAPRPDLIAVWKAAIRMRQKPGVARAREDGSADATTGPTTPAAVPPAVPPAAPPAAPPEAQSVTPPAGAVQEVATAS
jgi:hypothetical protein